MKPWLLLLLAILVGLAAWWVIVGGGAQDDALPRASEAPREREPDAAPGRRLIPEELPHERAREAVAPDAATQGEAPREAVVRELTEGLGLRALGDADREKLKVPERFKGGLVVTSVHPDSPAAEVSLAEGDVIVRAQRSDITSEEELKQQMEGRDHLLITVSRAGELFQVVLKPPLGR